jgi:arylsulfatase
VSWPKQLAKKETSNSLISTLDIFPTLVSLLGDSLPESVAPDGVSFANALKEPGAEQGGRKLLVNRDVKGTKSIRYGEWKYISNEYYTKVGPQTKGEVELYNLVMDKGESRNVAREFPEITSMLESVLEKVVKTSYSKRISQIGSSSLPK